MTTGDDPRHGTDPPADVSGTAPDKLDAREKQRRRELRAELEHSVAAAGYSLVDILPEIGKRAPRGRKRPARFRNPENPKETWTGVGRTPKWVNAILAELEIDVAAFKSNQKYLIQKEN